jgi:hypothetical protein
MEEIEFEENEPFKYVGGEIYDIEQSLIKVSDLLITRTTTKIKKNRLSTIL